MFWQLSDLNGTVWDFSDSRGVVDLQYVRGIDGASFEHATLHGVNQRGVTVVGNDFDAGAIELGVAVQPYRVGVRGQSAVNILSQWRDGLGEGETERGGNQMRLTLLDTGRFVVPRVKTKGPADWERMRIAGQFFDELVLQSDESDWRTDPNSYTFTAAEFATATVANDGTVDSWPWFKLTGPITLPAIGLSGEAIRIPTLGAGEWVTVETDPNWYAVTDQDGNDITFELYEIQDTDDRWRNSAPARTDDIEVTVITTGGTTSATKLEVVVPQIYRSAL